MKGLKAIDEATGKEVKIGDIVTSFRGERAVLCDITRVNEFHYGGGRSGKVVVKWITNDSLAIESYDDTMEYYDGVFNLRVEYDQ